MFENLLKKRGRKKEICFHIVIDHQTPDFVAPPGHVRLGLSTQGSGEKERNFPL